MNKNRITYDQVKRLGFEIEEMTDTIPEQGRPFVFATKEVGKIIKDDTIYSVIASWDCERLDIQVFHRKHGDAENEEKVATFQNWVNFMHLVNILIPKQ